MLGHKDQRMLTRYAHLLTTDLVRHHDQHSPADRLLGDLNHVRDELHVAARLFDR
jgi:hypothetical protein